MNRRGWGRRALVAGVWVVLGLVAARPAAIVAGGTVCPTGGQGPGDPHPGPAVPFIGGTVTSDAGTPIAGAAVLLARCVAGVPLPAGAALTAGDGRYAFAGLAADADYVVYAPLEGVLAGRKPAATTLNPSHVIDGGHGDDQVDLVFE